MPPEATDNLRVDLIDGRTGAVARTTLHSADFLVRNEQRLDALGGSVFSAEDFDGDGTEDVAASIVIAVFGDDPRWLLVESGATGAALVSRRLPSGGIVLAAGDLDGDGRADLFERTSRHGFSRSEVSVTALAGPLGAEAWQITDHVLPGGRHVLAPSDDLDGDSWPSGDGRAFDRPPRAR